MGLAIQSFDGVGGDGLFSILFYPDGNGGPRWGIAQSLAFARGQTVDVMQVNGYCRSCPMPAEQTMFKIGSMTLDLIDGGAGVQGSRVSVDVGFENSTAGRFIRTGAGILPFSDPTLGGN